MKWHEAFSTLLALGGKNPILIVVSPPYPHPQTIPTSNTASAALWYFSYVSLRSLLENRSWYRWFQTPWDLRYAIIIYSTKSWGYFAWVLPHTVLYCLVLPRLALCLGFSINLNIPQYFDEYEYTLHTANIHVFFPGILRKSITTSVANTKKHVCRWFMLGHTRQSKIRQDKAMCRVASARHGNKVSTGFEQYCFTFYIV